MPMTSKRRSLSPSKDIYSKRYKSDDPSEPADQEKNTIPATPFAGKYKPRSPQLLHQVKKGASVEGVDPIVCMSHLNCSYFSNDRAAPTLIQIKRHILSICNLLVALAVNDTSKALDWMELIGTGKAYVTSVKDHHTPLQGLANTLGHEVRGSSSAPTTECPLADLQYQKMRTREVLAHANDALEALDSEFAYYGGILSLLPPPNDELRESIEQTLLGQWMVYTANLSMRVAQLELEVENSRNILAGEATAPWVLGRSTFFGGGEGGEFGRNLLFPQDRYVLAGLSQGLWERVDEKLSRDMEHKLEQEIKMQEKVAGGKIKAGMAETVGKLDTRPPGKPLQTMAWIDVKSRLYRVYGHDTVFIIPGHGTDLNPETKMTARLEAMPTGSVVPDSIVNAANSEVDEMNNRLKEQENRIIKLQRDVQRLTRDVKRKDIELEELVRRLEEVEG